MPSHDNKNDLAKYTLFRNNMVFFLIFAVSAPTESLKVSKSFQDYMGEHSKLRTICEEGKGKLQWERDIPPKDLENLENLANSDFHANLGKIIHDIYLTGHNLFRYLHMLIFLCLCS